MLDRKLTVREWCELFGWSIEHLARSANVNSVTARKAYNRDPTLSGRSKMDIVHAIAAANGTRILVGDIEW